jgi:hypothetical protein
MCFILLLNRPICRFNNKIKHYLCRKGLSQISFETAPNKAIK